MNFEGNAFSAGAGAVFDAVENGGKFYFLQARGAGIELRAFDPALNRFESVASGISFADACWFFGGGLLELFGTRFSATSSEVGVIGALS